MPRFEITSPTGERFEITAPEGATDEQVMAYVKAQSGTKMKSAQSLVDQIPGGTQTYVPPSGPGEKGQAQVSPEMLAAHPVTRFALGAAAPILGLAQLTARNPVSRALGQDKYLDEKLAQLERMKKAGGAEGFDFAGLAGNVLSPASLATMKLPIAQSAGGRVAQGVSIGGSFGAASPVTGGDYDSTKAQQIGVGALLGGAIPAGIEGVGKGVRAIRNLVDPWLPGGVDRAVGRTGNAAAGDRREAVIAALERNRQIVPGSIPTAGEAAADAGSAEFAGLQRVVTGRKPSEYVAREAENEAARRGAIEAIGKDKAALDVARGVRATQGQQAYGEAGKLVVEADRTLAGLMDRPSMSKIIDRARDLAREQGRAFEVKSAEPAKAGLIVGESGHPLTQSSAQQAKYPVESLHYMKMAMDDLIKNPERFGIGAAEARAISGTQKQFVQWLGEKAPPYDAARKAYAQASVPINRMEVGQELEKALTSSLGTAERPAAFANAVRSAPQTIKRATGNPRFDTLDQVLDPTQMQGVGNVMADLKRSSQYEQLAKAGIEKARDLVGQVAPSAPAAGMFNPKYSVARAIINRLSGKVEGKSLDRLSEAMLDPALMARLMRDATPAERREIVAAMLERGLVIGGVGSMEGSK